MKNSKTARYNMEDSGLMSKFKSSVTSLINTRRHSLIHIRHVFVVIFACFILARSVTAKIEVSFDNDDVIGYRFRPVQLHCTATGTSSRPMIYWDRIKTSPVRCESLAPSLSCSHVDDTTGGIEWKLLNCGNTSTPTCSPNYASKNTITTSTEGGNTRKSTLEIIPLISADGDWKYACKAWTKSPSSEFGQHVASLTVRNGLPPSTTKPVQSSSSSNSSSTPSPKQQSGSIRAAGADNGVVVAISSAVLVAIINFV